MKIAVSLTTIPERINNVHYIIDMLLKQTCKPDSITLYVCCDEIPNRLLSIADSNPLFAIKKVNDMGPGTKWYYSLKENNDIVIFFDDDVFIHSDAINELLNYHFKYPTENLGFMGTIQNKFIHNEYLKDIDKYNVDLLGGYRGVLIPWYQYNNEQKNKLLSSFEFLCSSSKVLDDDYFLSKAWKHIKAQSSVVKSNSPWAFQFAIWSSICSINNAENDSKLIEDRTRTDNHFN